MAELNDFLSEAEACQFSDGVWDCCLFPAAWVERVTGIDGASPWRGRYRTPLGWARILKREGGIEGVLSTGAAIAGLTETTEPRRGDIGVIKTTGGPVAAICLGQRWVVASSRGLWVRAAPVLRSWSVPHG